MNLLFDLDGTLADPMGGITGSIAHALEQLGRPSPALDRLHWCIGPPLRGCLATLLGSDDPALIDQALSLYRHRYSTIGLYECRIYDDIPKTCQALISRGHTLFIATSKPMVFANRIADHFGLRPYFKKVYGSELDGTRNEKTDLIAHILERESIPPADTVMIGDRKFDMHGARANGVRGVGVLWGYGTAEELDAAGAHCCVEHPRELVAAIIP